MNNDLVAKRYVKALMEGRDLYTVGLISDKLNMISSAFGDDKFKSIVYSPEVSDFNKINLVISLVDANYDVVLSNFIKLLGEKRRLGLIPFIAGELKNQIAKINNNYVGIIYTNQELSYDYVQRIAQQFSYKFNVNLSLTQYICDYDGIKVDIDGLGVEISFSKDRFKSQLVDYILKAV